MNFNFTIFIDFQGKYKSFLTKRRESREGEGDFSIASRRGAFFHSQGSLHGWI